MRQAHLRRRRLLPLLASALLLAACQGAPPAAPGQPYAYTIGRGRGRVALTPRFVQATQAPAARRLQAQIAPRSVADIDRLVVDFVRVVYDEDGSTEIDEVAQGQITLQAAEIFNTVVVGDLANNTRYRFRAKAFAVNGALISDEAGSFVDLQVGTDDALVAGELKVRLSDVPFSGRASSTGLDVVAGGLSYPLEVGVHVTPAKGVTTVAGYGTPGFADSGEGYGGRLNEPAGLGVGADGSIFVADALNRRIRRYTPDGKLRTVAGDGDDDNDDGALPEASFRAPADVVEAADGRLFVVDSEDGTIRVVDRPQDEVTTFVTGLAGPRGLAIAPNGHVWVSDTDANGVVEYTADGTVVRRYGHPGLQPGFFDGSPTSARFDQPWGLACAPDGTIYVADRGNHAIRQIDPDGSISTYAGDGGMGSGNGDGEGSAAQFNGPTDLALDGDGTLYVADTGNHRIRRIDRFGTDDFAGSAQGYTNSLSLQFARFNRPSGLAVDVKGLVFVADTGGHYLRRIQAVGRDPG
jgi:sugar lactone lactonase YvrE